MTPVCPACRSPVGLDAHVCVNCGLAVRPTCSTCGEPLMFGMTSCWFCREPITEAPEIPRAAVVEQAAAAPTLSSVATLPAVAPVVPAVHPSVPVFPSRRRLSFLGAVFALLAAVFAIAATLLAVEIWMPRYTGVVPSSIPMEDRVFSDLGFSVAHPSDWKISESKKRVSITSGETGGRKATRGLRVAKADIDFDFDDVADEAKAHNRRRFDGYRTLRTATATVDGRDAYVVEFVGNDLRFEQWWIDRGKRSLRLEMWSRTADDTASGVNERIVSTLSLS